MAWYSKDWRFRTPVAVDLTAGVTPPVDVVGEIPPDLDRFWANVQASGDDVRVCDADGVTLLTYDLDGWDPVLRQGTIEVQGWTPATTDGVGILWLYWGNSSAADARTAFAPSSPAVGNIEPVRPGALRLRAGLEQPGATSPRQRLQKGSAEVLDVWWRLDPLLARYCSAGRGFYRREEPAALDVAGYDAGGPAAVVDRAATRLVECKGMLWARMRLTGGASGSDYTVELQVKSSGGQVLRPRALLRVEDVTD